MLHNGPPQWVDTGFSWNGLLNCAHIEINVSLIMVTGFYTFTARLNTTNEAESPDQKSSAHLFSM